MKKRSICKRLIALLACLCLLASCGGDGGTTETTQNGDWVASNLSILENGKSDYRIVYAATGEKWEKNAANRLKNSIYAATGVSLTVEADTANAADRSAKEIVIGTANSNRASTYTARGAMGLGYQIFVDGNRLIFEVYSQTGAFFAISEFCKNYLGADLEAGEKVKRNEALTSITVAADVEYYRALASSELPYLGTPLTDFSVACDELNFLEKALGIELAKVLANAAGLKERLPIYDRFMGLESDASYILLKQDESLPAGDWRYEIVSQKRIEVSANGYLGFVGAISALEARKSTNGYLLLESGETRSGSYLEALGVDETDKSTTYAYNRQGEVRVMFYNVLWGNANTNNVNTFPAIYRDAYQAALFEAYMPDVLALQEVNKTRRGKDASGDLVARIRALGYVETIDPRVKNAIPIEEGGYGTGGALEVTVNGETFYTYFNTNPLFYNPQTTKYLDGARVDFKVHGIGDEVVNAGEAGCKSMTWGLFETLATGERYIVISTHMRVNEIGLEQSKDAIALIIELESTYGCPVLFGGDMNSCEGQLSYDHMVSAENGFTALQKAALGSVYNARTKTTHGYPDYINGEMTIGGRAFLNSSVNVSIDNVMMRDLSGISIKVYGVIADFCSLRGSDHLPIFVDFDIP